MKVLIVSQYFWPENFRINDLATALSERGHEVTVLTSLPNYPAGRVYDGYWSPSKWRESYGRVDVRRVPAVPRGRSGRIGLVLNYLSFATIATLAAPVVCRGRWDVVFVFQPSPIFSGVPALLVSRLSKAPVFFWIQDLWPESLLAAGGTQSRAVLGMVGRLVNAIYNRCEYLLVQSMAFADTEGLRTRSVRYFPNWAEAFYRPVPETDAHARMRDLPPGFRILVAGNIGEAQAFATLVDAAERLKGTGLVWLVAGDGRRRAWLEGELRRRGLEREVKLVGSFRPEEMASVFAAADALFVGLRRDPTLALTVPSKVQSYLACGKPILAALDGEGARVVRESGAGMVAPAEDVAGVVAAASAMSALSPAALEQMGKNGLAYYRQHFDRDVLVRRLEGWMLEASGQKGNA